MADILGGMIIGICFLVILGIKDLIIAAYHRLKTKDLESNPKGVKTNGS